MKQCMHDDDFQWASSTIMFTTGQWQSKCCIKSQRPEAKCTDQLMAEEVYHDGQIQHSFSEKYHAEPISEYNSTWLWFTWCERTIQASTFILLGCCLHIWKIQSNWNLVCHQKGGTSHGCVTLSRSYLGAVLSRQVIYPLTASGFIW